MTSLAYMVIVPIVKNVKDAICLMKRTGATDTRSAHHLFAYTGAQLPIVLTNFPLQGQRCEEIGL
jgi:hypothetical protein